MVLRPSIINGHRLISSIGSYLHVPWIPLVWQYICGWIYCCSVHGPSHKSQSLIPHNAITSSESLIENAHATSLNYLCLPTHKSNNIIIPTTIITCLDVLYRHQVWHVWSQWPVMSTRRHTPVNCSWETRRLDAIYIQGGWAQLYNELHTALGTYIQLVHNHEKQKSAKNMISFDVS